MISIATIESPTCSDDDISSLYVVSEAIARETGAERFLEPRDRFAYRMHITDASHGLRCWLARDAAGAPVGAARLSWWHGDTNRRLAGFGVDVLPDARRQGLGTRLFAHVLDAAAEQGRTIVQTWIVEAGLGERFLPVFNGRLRSRMWTCELDLSAVDRALLDSWVQRARQRASEYSLIEWEERCPPAVMQQLVRVMGVMRSTPHDDLEVDEDEPTVEQLLEEERVAAEAGLQVRCVCARHDPSDTLIGYTVIAVPSDSHIAHQGDTVVDPAHRNRGVGRWLKAAMLLRLLEQRPDVERVRTENAASNDAMLSINNALGFHVVRANGIWQVPVADALAAVCQRGARVM